MFGISKPLIRIRTGTKFRHTVLTYCGPTNSDFYHTLEFLTVTLRFGIFLPKGTKTDFVVFNQAASKYFFCRSPQEFCYIEGRVDP